MGMFSVYTANKVLDLLMNASAFTAPSPIYAALFTSANGLATNVVLDQDEISGGSYTRIDASSVFGSAASSSITNSDGSITFPTATSDWGTITHVALMDAATSGNVLVWSALGSSRNVLSGDRVVFDSSNMTWTIS